MKNMEEVITTHVNADFDALASMIAASKLYPNAMLVFPGSQEKNLRNFFLHSTSYLFNFTKVRHVDFDKVTRLILVDTRQRNRIGRFLELLGKEGIEIHIYDHHPNSQDDIHGDVEHIQIVGATTTILTEIIRERGISLTPDEATIMTLGIHEDTGSFTFSSTRAEDYRAAAWLTDQGANHNLVADMLTRELTAEQVWLLNDLTKSAKTHTINGIEVIISTVTRDDYIGDFAVLVHKFMEMENLNVVFALAQMEEKVYLVARSRLRDVNAAEVALAFGGGGHPEAASATIKNKPLIQVERSLRNLLGRRINPKRLAKDMMASPVIHVSPEETIGEAARKMTQYNINVLIVMDEKGTLKGYITRQIVEKAVYFDLGHVHVSDYTNIEFSTIHPDAALEQVQDLIIRKRLRILPVLENDNVVGVITRTDLLNILVGGPVVHDFFSDDTHGPLLKKKSMAAMLKERLPKKILSLLRDLGSVADELQYEAYLVGGLVRDVFLKRENLDVDVVIEGDGIHFAHAFAEKHNVKVRSHKKFATAVLIFPDGFKVDVATARMEYYESPAAPPVVETSSLKLDLLRRDFTVNTLAVTLNKRRYGTLVDYFEGQKDIKERVIRVLHNLSFVEDPTRILRAIRFEQRFDFRIGKLTRALIKNAVDIDCFENLSGRRLFLELRLLLAEKDPIKAIARMNEFEILQFIHPEIEMNDGLKSLLEGCKAALSWFDLLYLDEPYETWKVYWHALMSALEGSSLEELQNRMQMKDHESNRMIAQEQRVGILLDELYRFRGQDRYHLYTLLSQYDTDILLYAMAKANNEKIKRHISTFFTKLKGMKTLLKGRDLKAMGFEPGPLYREILDRLLAARLNGHIITKRDETAFVMEHFGTHLSWSTPAPF
jgi:tRNA nucleotidyltransferase (CCA-adding enzyme)